MQRHLHHQTWHSLTQEPADVSMRLMLWFQVTKESKKHWLVLLEQWAHCCPAWPATIPCNFMPSLNCSSLKTSGCPRAILIFVQPTCRPEQLQSLQLSTWSMNERQFPKKISYWCPFCTDVMVQDMPWMPSRDAGKGMGVKAVWLLEISWLKLKGKNSKTYRVKNNPCASNGIHSILMTRLQIKR